MAPETALDRLRQPHLNAALKAVRYLEKAVPAIRLSLEAGRVPERYKVVSAAVDLVRGLVALEAIEETARACGAGEDGT